MSLLGSIVDVVGGIFNSKAQKKGQQNILNDYNNAQGTALAAQNQAQDARYSFNAPWQQGGLQGFQNMLNMQTPGFQYSPSDPSYAWRLGQGTRAIDASSAAAGLRNSGGTLRALQDYGQGLASTEFNNDFTRNNLLAGYGQHATDALDQAKSDWANNYGNILFKGAEGRASAYQGKANANSSLVGTLTGGAKNVLGDLAGFFGGGSPSGGMNITGADGGFIPF